MQRESLTLTPLIISLSGRVLSTFTVPKGLWWGRGAWYGWVGQQLVYPLSEGEEGRERETNTHTYYPFKPGKEEEGLGNNVDTRLISSQLKTHYPSKHFLKRGLAGHINRVSTTTKL